MVFNPCVGSIREPEFYVRPGTEELIPTSVVETSNNVAQKET